jgi:hypothetical protein
MAFSPIDLNTIKVGDPITRDLWLLLKDNMDDHELRINSLSTSGGTVFIFNGDVSFVGFNISQPNIFYYKSRQDFSINDFRVQLFDKQGIVLGNLTFELEKSIDTNNTNFSTVLSSALSFNFASDSDYSEKVALIDSAENSILTDQVVRVRVTNVPTNSFGYNFSGKVLISVGAQ